MHEQSAIFLALSVIAFAIVSAPALAWNARGHAAVTYLAMDGFVDDAPAWLRSDRTRRRIAYAASEADRWRGTRIKQLVHENAPDHYLDIELLDQFGLKLSALPRFRYVYVAAMARAKHAHPERVEPYNPEEDLARSHEWPGFLPYSIMERYGKVRSSLHTVRVLERLNDPARADHLKQARSHAMFQMGMLSHFVAD